MECKGWGLLCGDESLDGVLCLVLQPPPCCGKAFVGSLVGQDHGQREVIQARAVGGSVPGAHGTGVFGFERYRGGDGCDFPHSNARGYTGAGPRVRRCLR